MTAGAHNFNKSFSQKCLQISKIIQSSGGSFDKERPGTPPMVRTGDDAVCSVTKLKTLLTIGMTLHDLAALDEILILDYVMFSLSWVFKNMFP